VIIKVKINNWRKNTQQRAARNRIILNDASV